MSVRQLSVFAENEKGSLSKIISLLADHGLDLRSICVADTERYGILRIIANRPDEAKKVLTDAGFTARVRQVVVVAIPDEPGSLAAILKILGDAGINLEYMYSVLHGAAEKAFMALRVDDNERTESLLKEAGYEVLSEKEV